MKIEGLDKLLRKLDDLSSGAARLEKGREVPLSDLFPPRFMVSHTQHPTIEAFLLASGVDSADAFNALPKSKINAHVRRHSGFSTWQAMLDEAVREYVAKELGLR